MAEKLSGPNKATFLILSLSIILSSSLLCRVTAEETESVSLEDFNVGIVRHAPRRYLIKDITVGNVSVRRLFNLTPRPGPAWYPGGYLRYEKFVIIIIGGKELDELKQILIAHPELPLKVVLQDAWNPFGNSEPYEYSIPILVTLNKTECDKVTRLIYEKIISKLIKEGKEEKEKGIKTGQADRRLDINEVFDKLRDDKEIEAYINRLGPPIDSPCVETIRLLKSQTVGKVAGFGSGKYILTKEIQDGLILIINAMATDRDWWMSDLSVKITGFTDEVEVAKTKGIELDMAGAGISADAWSKVNNRFEVYYSGCKDNDLKVKDQPVYLGFIGSAGEQQVGTRLTNNCELGAVRAYVAMVYLTSVLGRTSIADSYATGGIYSGSDARTMRDDPYKRRIRIEFVITAARVEKSNL